MKKIPALAISVLLTALSAGAWTVPDETLHYAVRYKWGFIDANAGIATLSTVTNPANGTFTATLSGKSVDLLGHYYTVADNMTGTIMANTFEPVYTQHLTNESGEFAIETITYDQSGSSAKGEIVKRLPNGEVVRSRVSHYAGGLTLDLLAVFYYVRQIPYEQMQPGQSVTVNIFAGQTPETLTITYNGQQTRTVNGNDVNAFSTTLVFSTQTPTETSDTMDILISNDGQRAPVLINGALKFGHIECTLLGEEAENF